VKLLVTGGAGYIGSVVAARLLEGGHEVVVLDDLSTGHRDGVPDGARFVRGRVHEVAEVLEPGVDGVLHFAAKSLVAESVERPELYWDGNVVGTLALLNAMRATGVQRLVFSSTAAAYGEPNAVPIREDDPPVPINPYGHSKLAVDMAITGFARAHGLTHARPSGPVPGPRPDRRPARHRLPHAGVLGDDMPHPAPGDRTEPGIPERVQRGDGGVRIRHLPQRGHTQRAGGLLAE
jgi:nucleoside-diphosphate-sugar epimerase